MLVVALLLATASQGASLPTAKDAKVKAGIEQARDGLLEAAVATFNGAVEELEMGGSEARDDIVVAHVHRGAAMVALQRESAAREAFRRALRIQPALRLARGEFPDRVVRVFEAARTGMTGSAMERPAGAAKKAGLGAAGIAAIAGGAALIITGGAVAVAAGGPSPVPVTIALVNASPAGGSTISLRTQAFINLIVTISSPMELRDHEFHVDFGGPGHPQFTNQSCVTWSGQRTTLAANETRTVTLPVVAAARTFSDRSCSLPFTTQTVGVSFEPPGQFGARAVLETFSIPYTFVP